MSELILFHPFKIRPPGTGDVLAELHDAFARTRSAASNCARCMVADQDDSLCTSQCMVVTDPLRLVLFHAIDSGEAVRTGAIRHLLPHALENMFFDDDIFPNLAVQAFRGGAWFWSEAEQAALRNLFCRVAVDWFSGREPAPLSLSPELRHYPSGQIFDWRQPAMSSRIVEALILMRIRPDDVMDWLVKTGGRRAINWIVQAVIQWTLVDRPGDEEFHDLPFHVQRTIEVKVALDRLANHALFNALTPERLFYWWQECVEVAPELAERIEDIEAAFSAHDRQLSYHQYTADLAMIEGYLGEGAACRVALEDLAQG